MEVEEFADQEQTFWHDGTEGAINRPKSEEKPYYSAKKKCNTIKKVILIDVYRVSDYLFFFDQPPYFH